MDQFQEAMGESRCEWGDWADLVYLSHLGLVRIGFDRRGGCGRTEVSRQHWKPSANPEVEGKAGREVHPGLVAILSSQTHGVLQTRPSCWGGFLSTSLIKAMPVRLPIYR